MTLDDYMKVKCLNCSQLARATKVSPQTISRIVKGKRKPSIKLAYKIAKVLGAKPIIAPKSITYQPTPIHK